MKLLLLGATGLVGSRTLQLALANPDVTEVIAPTRHPLAAHERVLNPVGARLEELIPSLLAQRPDAVICALGTTQAAAGSKAAFRHVDYELPLVVGQAAHAAGVATFVMVTAMGASANASSFYYRTKGEVERELQGIGFRSLTFCRPSLIGGERAHARRAEGAALTLLRLLAPILPKKFRINPAEAIASALLTAAIAAAPGRRWIYAQDMN